MKNPQQQQAEKGSMVDLGLQIFSTVGSNSGEPGDDYFPVLSRLSAVEAKISNA